MVRDKAASLFKACFRDALAKISACLRVAQFLSPVGFPLLPAICLTKSNLRDKFFFMLPMGPMATSLPASAMGFHTTHWTVVLGDP